MSVLMLRIEFKLKIRYFFLSKEVLSGHVFYKTKYFSIEDIIIYFNDQMLGLRIGYKCQIWMRDWLLQKEYFSSSLVEIMTWIMLIFTYVIVLLANWRISQYKIKHYAGLLASKVAYLPKIRLIQPNTS